MDGLADWTSSVGAELGAYADAADTERLVALAKELRRAVAKPAALTAVYLLGVAVGRGADADQAAAQLADLAKQWPASTCDWRD